VIDNNFLILGLLCYHWSSFRSLESYLHMVFFLYFLLIVCFHFFFGLCLLCSHLPCTFDGWAPIPHFDIGGFSSFWWHRNSFPISTIYLLSFTYWWNPQLFFWGGDWFPHPAPQIGGTCVHSGPSSPSTNLWGYLVDKFYPNFFFWGEDWLPNSAPTIRWKMCPFRPLIPTPPIYGDTWLTNYNQNFFSGQIP